MLRCGVGLKGAVARAKARDVSTEGANEVSDGGAQRAHRALAAGALEVSAVDAESMVYKRAAETLAVFAADLRFTVYKRSTSALEVVPTNRPGIRFETAFATGTIVLFRVVSDRL